MLKILERWNNYLPMAYVHILYVVYTLETVQMKQSSSVNKWENISVWRHQGWLQRGHDIWTLHGSTCGSNRQRGDDAIVSLRAGITFMWFTSDSVVFSWAKIKVLTGLYFLLETLGRFIFLPFPALRGHLHSFVVAPPPIFKASTVTSV